MEVKLRQHNYHFTTGEIIENLKNMNVVNNHDIYYQSTYSGSELYNALNEVFGLNLNKEYYQPKVLRKKSKKFYSSHFHTTFFKQEKKVENPYISRVSTFTLFNKCRKRDYTKNSFCPQIKSNDYI